MRDSLVPNPVETAANGRPAPTAFASLFALDPRVVYLNHGSFGACPRAVLLRQSELREQLEANPTGFFGRDYGPMLDATRATLARFLGCNPDGLAFVANATTGVNAVLRSLALEPGDELLVTDHEYNACKNALDFVAARSGARAVVVPVPFPPADPAEVVDAIVARATPRTRLALVDHVTSPTALVLPIAEIVRALAARGIDTLVDGAHAPGALDLDIAAIAPAYYTGHCHKWMCAPKSTAFLFVREDLRQTVRPTVISHGANAPTDERPRFRSEFDWPGTPEPTSILSIPTAIETLDRALPGGWPALRETNRNLALAARDLLYRELAPDAPLPPDELIGTMVSVPLPPLPEGTRTPFGQSDPLQRRLAEECGIEVPILHPPARGAKTGTSLRLLRISAMLYNDLAQIDYLAKCTKPRL